MNNIDILEEELRKDILFEIDMKLYDEFNDKFCEIEENLGTVYSYKDLEDLKKAESDTERTLLREAISNLIAENKELKEKNNELDKKDKVIDMIAEDIIEYEKDIKYYVPEYEEFFKNKEEVKEYYFKEIEKIN